MGSRGKGKKPLGNEGKAQGAKQDPRVLNVNESGEPETPDDGCFYIGGRRVLQLHVIDFEQTSMMRTYHLIEAVLQERARSLPVALAKNTFRHGANDRWKDWTASASAGAVVSMAIDPVVGLVVAVVGAMTRNVIEVFRLRRGRHKEIAPGKSKAGAEVRMMIHEMIGDLPTKIDLRGKLPDLPEFNNEWVRLSHRLIRLSLGYNVRVDVVNRIRIELARDKMPADKARILSDTADGMTEMLLEVRPRLEEVAHILEELQPIGFMDLRKLEEHDDRLQTNDLLGEDRGEAGEASVTAASLLWLDVPYEQILIREAPKVYETDKAVCEGRIELDEELSLERRFVRLEEKLAREREELEILKAQIESLPSEERAAAAERLESILERLREIASLDIQLEVDIDDGLEKNG
ncbi:MAG: hypothetical protein AAB554_03190 [Patescibacteria group bacterium]